MAYNQPTCDETGAITGWSENCSTDLAVVVKLFMTDFDFQFATQTLAESETQWGLDIVAKNIYPIPLLSEMDDNSEAPVPYVSPITSASKIIREGKGNYTYRIEYEPCLHARLRSAFNNKKIRVIEIDANNNVIGTSPDDIVFKGLEANVHVGAKVASSGDVPAFTPINVSYLSSLEREDQPAVFNVDWNIKGLNGIQPATLTEVGTSTATTIIVDVATSCDGVALTGLDENSFRFIEADGTTEEVISAAVESTTIPGRYTLTATAFTTLGTLNIYDQTLTDTVLTVGTYYYQGTAIIITF